MVDKSSCEEKGRDSYGCVWKCGHTCQSTVHTIPLSTTFYFSPRHSSAGPLHFNVQDISLSIPLSTKSWLHSLLSSPSIRFSRNDLRSYSRDHLRFSLGVISSRVSLAARSDKDYKPMRLTHEEMQAFIQWKCGLESSFGSVVTILPSMGIHKMTNARRMPGSWSGLEMSHFILKIGSLKRIMKSINCSNRLQIWSMLATLDLEWRSSWGCWILSSRVIFISMVSLSSAQQWCGSFEDFRGLSSAFNRFQNLAEFTTSLLISYLQLKFTL